MSLFTELPPYDERDLRRWFNGPDLAASDAYLNAVRVLQVSGGAIVATVQGTARHPYAVHIVISQARDGQLHLNAACGCPVGWFCKHTAAVLRVLLRQQPARPAAAVNPDVLRWLEGFRQAIDTPTETAKRVSVNKEALFYVLDQSYDGAWEVSFAKSRIDKHGQPGTFKDWDNVERALLQPPAFVREDDLPILRLLWASRRGDQTFREYVLHGAMGEDLLQRMLASGRLLLGPEPYRPAGAGEPRAAMLLWRRLEDSQIAPRIVAQDETAIDVIALAEIWYLDRETGRLGLLNLPYPAHRVAQLLTMPPLSEADLPVVAGALAELAPELPAPSAPRMRIIDVEPTPVLSLGTANVYGVNRYRDYPPDTRQFDYAALGYKYDGLSVAASGTAEFITTPAGEAVHVKRRPESEKRLAAALGQLGFIRVPPHNLYLYGAAPASPMLGLASEAHWPAFMAGALPTLRASGWELVIPPGFRHHVLEVEAWDAEFAEAQSGWFSLDMGIVVAGKRLPLAPLLHHLFQEDPRWLDAGKLALLPDDTPIDLFTPDGARVRVPAERLKPIARTLIDLFDGKPADTLRVSRFDAPRLAELTDMKRWKFKGAASVQNMAARLKKLGGIKPIKPPKGLALELRPYQREGLAWLQYLREHELAGILADDMGLGKTAQTLAHLLLEKEAGRLDKPALVVLPTSLIFNWKREAERFAPALRVLSLHGKDRAERFPLIPESDVCLTTYPLLWRDVETLAKQEFHLLILDEAQTVKNASSQAAQVVRQLQTRHRLCLTGTPLENHLGELWSQFDFLLPGFLADSKSFTKTWRTPIEKNADSLRRDLLAARLKPFILRRRKEDVAKELPPKTIIVRTVELEGGQRDLYETVRTAMDVRVRDEIASKGFNRSQIVILDALLKLRQVCCDPRLLKLDAARRVRERAKLDLLMAMLPELVDEGRKVLVFSQFTSMLALIAAELAEAKIPFTTLTGDTGDREGVIKVFQEGDVPVFLISLKAGGVGLNLTAADTVIHFDPWWNPAVENQATDRAHRLGQTKNVFVYKLVVSGSIEEKILALQEKKAELAASVLSGDGAALGKFGAADIQALLAPLPAPAR
ncbi:MAG: DEAD/DEAH box helicase [Gallionellaceae bacterium]|nr:DEAD/DEAH box helicase [Gallionellaceae bacterium]